MNRQAHPGFVLPRVLFLMVWLLLPGPLTGQESEYQPIQRWPGIVETGGGVEFHPTKELLAVMISSSWCGGNGVEGFDGAIQGMKDALAARADSLGYSFSAIGVAVDWDIPTGVRYLLDGHSTSGQLEFGSWGEIVAGRDWLNSASSLYAIPTGLRFLAVPHVIVLERTLIPHETYVELTEPRFLFRVSGGEDIVQWAAEGFPVPNLPYDPDRRPETGEVH